MHIHQVWLHGQTDPLVFTLDTTDLFQAFRHWVQGDGELSGNGFVLVHAGEHIVLNFRSVAMLKTKPAQTATAVPPVQAVPSVPLVIGAPSLVPGALQPGRPEA